MIRNYPKSSCTCYNYEKRDQPTGPPTNMSVRGCNFQKYVSPRVFKSKIEPTDKNGLSVLNPGVVSKDKFDQNMKAINYENCPKTSCPGTTYLNNDPRLYSSVHAEWLQLNRPPLMSNTDIGTLNYNKKLDSYGKNYKSYSDVNAGQVVYYISKDIEDVLYNPLFSEPAHSIGTLYKDPMGAMKPHYDRIPLDPLDPLDQEYCLSWMKDSQHHREDILSKQMQKINQTRYAPRWTE